MLSRGLRAAIENYEERNGLVKEREPTTIEVVNARLKRVMNPVVGLDLIRTKLVKEIVPYLIARAADVGACNAVLIKPNQAGTLSEAREEMKKGHVPTGMTKDVFMSMKFEQAVIEDKGYDLVVMGQPEGAGCYCAANTLLTGFLERLTKNYPYVVMDNEAGMEHISRLTTSNIDILLIVADTSRRGLQAGMRIDKLSKELNIGVGRSCLILNQSKDAPAPAVLHMLENADLELAGSIPEDQTVYEFDLEGRATIELPESNEAVQSAFDIFDKIIPKK